MDIHGNHLKAGTIGVLGGFMGQLILALSAVEEKCKEKDITFLSDPKVI